MLREFVGGRSAVAKLLAEKGYTFGVEVGVERGVHAKLLCQKIPGLTLYCIDPWEYVPGYRDHVPQERLDEFYAETRKRLKPCMAVVWKMTSVDAARRFDSVNFVYLDGDHRLEAVRADIEAWWPKVRAGGALLGHDYDDVSEAVLERFEDVDVYGDGEHARTWIVWK